MQIKALALLALAFLGAGAASAAVQTDEKPLLMPDKTTLYQRVLTTPSCKLHQKADLSDVGEKVPAFSQYYVYAAQDGKPIKVGSNSTGLISGYLDSACVVPWKQQLAMLFTNSAGRNRALIFNEEADLDALIDNEGGEEVYKKMLQDVEAGKHVDQIISIEPKEYVDYQQNFYLLPILESSESMFTDGSYVYKHKIASITADEAKSSSAALAPKAEEKKPLSDEAAIVGFKAAVVFVIDASISMQPYIDRTKQAINSIYKSMQNADLSQSVQFGIVSFRGDSRAVPSLEYTAKMFLKPGDATSAEEFSRKVESLSQANVSSAQFNEDSYAGINLALQDINWSQYGGRYIVLITDAGAIDGSDKQSSTGLDANALRLEAEHYGAAIYTLHLLTPSGKKNHASAKQQYEQLSYNPILNKPLYYPVNAGNVTEYGQIVEQLAQSITAQVEQASLGQLSAGSSLAANEQPTPSTPAKQIVDDAKQLGYAMQLAYLGRVKGTKSPDFLQGYIADRDMVDHSKVVSTPIVLVNRNQLSDLHTLVKGVLAAGISGQLSSDDMFAQLQALAAQMGRDPNQLDRSKSISEMGIMGELLDDLPYKSKIASLSTDDWYNLGSQEQETIVRSLETSLNYIEQCASDNDRFIKLNEDADSTEEVYPIPLDALP